MAIPFSFKYQIILDKISVFINLNMGSIAHCHKEERANLLTLNLKNCRFTFPRNAIGGNEFHTLVQRYDHIESF